MWHEKTTSLESLLRNLPSQKNDGISGIPYKMLIPVIARELMLMSPVPRKNSGSIKKGTKRELGDLARAIDRTIKLLGRLSDTAIDALGVQRVALHQLEASLEAVAGCIESARTVVRGAPKKVQPQAIAQVAARH